MAPTTLLNFPVELFYKISEGLSYASHIALSFTCQELYAKLNIRCRLSASSPQGKAYTMNDLLKIEEWPEYNPLHSLPELHPAEYLACRICLKLLPRDKFSRLFRRGCYSRQNTPVKSKEMLMKLRRGQVCISCTLANRLPGYEGPAEFFTNGLAVYLGLNPCGRCEEFFPNMLLIKSSSICQCCGDIMLAEIRGERASSAFLES